MAKMTNTFNQGMDQDTSKNKYDDKHYYSANNVRITSQDGLSGGALEDIEGTLERVTLGDTLRRIIGYCVLRDDIILFIGTSFSGNPSYIVRVPIEELEALTTNQTYPIDFVNYHVSPGDGYNLIYTEDMGFTIGYPIKAIPRYENELVQKVYWVDGYHNLRHINTVYNADTNDLVNLPLDRIEVIGNSQLIEPYIREEIAGNIRAGKVQYAYQLYQLHGSATLWSPISDLFHVTEADDYAANSTKYFGSDIDVNTGKGFYGEVDLNSSDETYSRIRIVAINYYTQVDEPEIRIILEGDIYDDRIGFRDTGQNLGTYTLEELRVLATSLFSAGDLETKDNILFPANISEDAFDIEFDARAYRFGGSSGTSTAYNYMSNVNYRLKAYVYGSTNYVISPGGSFTGGAGGTNWQLPTDADLRCTFNDIDSDGDTGVNDNRFKFQEDGSTIGGTGPNVSYYFDTKQIEVDQKPVSTFADIFDIHSTYDGATDVPPEGLRYSFSYEGYASPYIAGRYAGYFRDEVYRFGIVLFDARGRSSFVKWIGDIRMPSANSNGTTYEIMSAGIRAYANILYPVFEVDTSSIASDIESYQIVRVLRTSTDRSILAQGFLNEPKPEGTADTFVHENWFGATYNTVDMYQFHSPEVSFNADLVLRPTTDYLQIIGEGTNALDGFITGPSGTQDYMQGTRYYYYDNIGHANEYNAEYFSDMDEGRVVKQNEVQVTLGAYHYITEDVVDRTRKGIHFLLLADNATFDAASKTYGSRSIANYRRNVYESQYGGNTFQARKYNEYIAASKVTDKAVTSLATFGGDTYIETFDCMYSSHLNGYGVHAGGLRNDWLGFAVETTIVQSLRYESAWSKVYEEIDACFIQDEAGVYDDGGTRLYAQLRDQYIYNPVYSKQNTTKIFIDAPFDWSALTTFDTRILASLTKVNGEAADSWLLYPANQVIDVDPQYGPVTAVKLVNNRLLYFQDSAFGVVSVNDRALIETGNVSQLSLGVAGLLDRYDYAKTDIGCYHWRHLALTSNALYWVDLKGKAMYRYGKGPEELSLMKGMDSWFRDNIPDEQIDNKFIHYQIGAGMSMWQDPEFKEIYLTDETGNYTLMYSEVTDSFVGFTDHDPSLVMNYLDKTLSFRLHGDIHRHNDFYSNRGYIYDAYRQISVTLLINPHPDDTAVFNNFEWLTEATTSGVDQPETWEIVHLWNDYQSTRPITLTVGDNVKRRMRKWRYIIPRSVELPDGSPNPDGERYARMRDTHLFASFAYTGADDKEFIIHDIITSFTISNK